MHHVAFNDLCDAEILELYGLAGWRKAEEGAEMRAAQNPVRRNLISFDDLFLALDRDIRKGGLQYWKNLTQCMHPWMAVECVRTGGEETLEHGAHDCSGA